LSAMVLAALGLDSLFTGAALGCGSALSFFVPFAEAGGWSEYWTLPAASTHL